MVRRQEIGVVELEMQRSGWVLNDPIVHLRGTQYVMAFVCQP